MRHCLCKERQLPEVLTQVEINIETRGMIIIASKVGQLGNSLILYANLLAFGKEHGLRVFNPAFYNYQSYFKFTCGRNRFLWRMMYLVFYYARKVLRGLKSSRVKALDYSESVNLDDPDCLPYARSGFVFIQGWRYRGVGLLSRYRDLLTAYFSPAPFYAAQIDNFFRQHFEADEVIIGLHIRLGDYKEFEDGKYYYSAAQYMAVSQKIARLFPGKKIHFLLSSNEKINLPAFVYPGARFTPAPFHELVDMYCLARCNYLSGPPSTYTMWASFFGEVPLYMIHDTGKEISLDDFKIEKHLQ
jgi:hypothetical protein